MDVTRSNLLNRLPVIKEQINNADFISIDTELTGIWKGQGKGLFDDHQDRYSRLRDSLGTFSTIQFGLSCFKRLDKADHFSCQSFNIYIFPYKVQGIPKMPDRNIHLQSSAVSFLKSNGFDFNHLIEHGISYIRADEEDNVRRNIQEQEERNAKMQIHVPEDQKEFVNENVSKIREFVSDPSLESLSLNPCNAYRRRLLYGALASDEFQDIYVTTNHPSCDQRDCFLFIAKSSAEDKKIMLENTITEGMGFTRILKLIIDSKKPIVGHNLFIDLMHCVNQFLCELPESYQEYKDLIHALFPNIYDTKFISKTAAFLKLIPNNGLKELKERLDQDPFPSVKVDSESDGSETSSPASYHNASYDSYITGCCFIIMNNYLEKEFAKDTSGSAVGQEIQRFVNRLHLTFSFDLDHYYLGGKDVPVDRHHVFHLEFPVDWTTQTLNQLFSPFGGYNIQWVDDSSAVVGLKNSSKAKDFLKSIKNAEADSKLKVTSYSDFIQKKRKVDDVETDKPLDDKVGRTKRSRNVSPTNQNKNSMEGLSKSKT